MKDTLKDYIKELYKLNGYTIERSIQLTGSSGTKHKLDFIAKKPEVFHTTRVGISFKKGFISRNFVQEFSDVIEDIGLDRGAIFGDKYSPNVKSFATKHNIDLTSEDKLIKSLKAAGLNPQKRKPAFPKIPVILSIRPLKLKDMFFRKLDELNIDAGEIELKNMEAVFSPYWVLDYKVYEKLTKEEKEVEVHGKIHVNAVSAKEVLLPEETFDKEPMDRDEFNDLATRYNVRIKEPVVTGQSAKMFIKQTIAERYKVGKSDVLTSNEKMLYLPIAWNLIYSFKGKSYEVFIDGIRGIIEHLEIPELNKEEAEKLAREHIEKRYDETELKVEDIKLEDEIWKLLLSSDNKGHQVEIDPYSTHIKYLDVNLLRKKAIQIATSAVKEKYEEGKLQLEKTDKNPYEWTIILSTSERIYTTVLDSATGDVQDIHFIYTEGQSFEFARKELTKEYVAKDTKLVESSLVGDTWNFDISSGEGEFTATVDRKEGKVLDIKMTVSDKRAKRISERYLAKNFSEFKPIFEKTGTSLLKKNILTLEYLSNDGSNRFTLKVDKRTGEVKDVDKEAVKEKSKGLLSKLKGK